jgi:HD-GYP domain-containing protein (c-di-GMP phosphodiesterase class II)
MTKPNWKVRGYVAAVSLLSVCMFALLWTERPPSPGVWELSSFVLVAFLLDQSSNRLKVGAIGSTSFIIHLAAGILFGGAWGALVAAASTALNMLAGGTEPLKLTFNVAQRALSVTAAVGLYSALGGSLPPSYLQTVGVVSSHVVQRDLILFFALAAFYVVVNSTAVSGVVALSTQRHFRDVWYLNTRGVVGYDLAASAVALLIAWLYTKSSQVLHFGSFGLLGVIIPLVVVRHIYGLYYQLQESGQELLEVMVKAIEARDPYTSGHSRRVKELSRTIALELGLPARQVEQIETAALLHDVGKIHEEFAPLLRKDARLTDAETALMQTHATKSADLVGIISKFRGFIQDSVRHHHERWDGRGYPAGLVGEAIPIGARIIIVADTIDAMTTDRPYRKRLSLDQVIAELQRCRGAQFDQQIVDLAVASVAVRRLIVQPPSILSDTERSASASRRSPWGNQSLWRVRRAL